MKIRYILLTFVALSMVLVNTMNAAPAIAKGKKEGYIVTKSGEKINGHVTIKNNITLDQVKIKFIDYKGQKFSYKAKDISGYGYRDIQDTEWGGREWAWVHYESRNVSVAPIPFGPKTVFMERVAEGDVVLFQYWIQVNSNIENPYKRYFFLERNGERVELTNENFVQEASSFFSDNVEIAQNMGQVNHRFRHMKRVVNNYNNWKARQVASNS